MKKQQLNYSTNNKYVTSRVQIIYINYMTKRILKL